MKIQIATAPCSWGVFYADGGTSGVPYEVFLQQAAEAGWVEEWMYVFIHGCSDPDVIFEEYWYDESLGQWPY